MISHIICIKSSERCNLSPITFYHSPITFTRSGWSGVTPCSFFHSPIRRLTSMRAAIVSHNRSSNSSISARSQLSSVSLLTGEAGLTVKRSDSVSGLTANERERSFKRHTHQVHAMLGGRAYPIGHENQLAMFLLNNILGGGSLNSRLNLSLREARGLVYTVESTYTPLSDTGYWCVYWACDPEDYDHSLSLVNHELDLLQAKPLTESALKRALVQLRGQLAISAQNQENSALSMAKSVLYRDEAPSWQETMEKIEQTDIMQLQHIAQDIFNPSNTYILKYE